MRVLKALFIMFLVGGFAPLSMAQMCVQTLTDPGLNSNSQPLGLFNSPLLDRWLQEQANLVVGTQLNGVAPFEGNGMLQIHPTGGVVSQVRQRIDVSALSGAIALGNVRAFVSGRVNASVGGTQGGVLVSTFGGTPLSTSGYIFLDANTATWEKATASVNLPVGTTHVEIQFLFTNSLLPLGESGYGDGASLVLFEAATAVAYDGLLAGSIVNPDRLATTPMRIGSNWSATITPQVARTGTPGFNLALVLVYTQGPPGASIIVDLAPILIGVGSAPGSQLLVSGSLLGSTIANWGTSSPGVIAIPCVTSFICMPWYSQAIVLGNVTTDGVFDLDPMFTNGVTGLIGAP